VFRRVGERNDDAELRKFALRRFERVDFGGRAFFGKDDAQLFEFFEFKETFGRDFRVRRSADEKGANLRELRQRVDLLVAKKLFRRRERRNRERGERREALFREARAVVQR